MASKPLFASTFRICCNQLATLLAFPFLTHPAGALGQTPQSCPWMNQATASGLLGGDAGVSASEASGDRPATCTFTHKLPGLIRVLRITVETRIDAHDRFLAAAKSCGADATPLRAVGNEAVVCADHSAGGPGERVFGRVRDQVFTITLTSSQRGDATFKHDLLRAKIATAAEQISGNLF